MNLKLQCVTCGAYAENAYIVSGEGSDRCAVIDPGDDLGLLRRAIGDRRVDAILLTHGHFDHILSAQPLAEAYHAPVYIHPADSVMLNDPSLNAYDAAVSRQRAPVDLAAQPLGECVQAAGLNFQVLHTPGHSPGSVCFLLDEEATLFTGDTLFEAGYGRLDLYGGSASAMRASLRRLFELPDAMNVYPGHGGATTIGREKARYRL